MIFPWTIHEAEVALYPARKDGWPMTGPSASRGPVPILMHRSSLRVEAILGSGAPAAMDFTGSAAPSLAGYSLQVDFPEGALEDALTLAKTAVEPGGYYCLSVRFEDSSLSGIWSAWRFFYVTLESDATGDDDQVMQRSLRFRSSYRQELVGLNSPPDLRPDPMGEVEWVCGPMRVTALLYNPETASWTSTPQNIVTVGENEAPFVAVGEEDGRAFLSYYLPEPENEDGPTLSGDPEVAGTPLKVGWHHHFAFIVEPDHRLAAQGDFNVQTNGTPEPLLLLPQSRLWDEPMVLFRYLNRIYMSVGHFTVAIPSLSSTLPPPTHEPDFRLGSLRILPFGGFFPPA